MTGVISMSVLVLCFGKVLLAVCMICSSRAVRGSGEGADRITANCFRSQYSSTLPNVADGCIMHVKQLVGVLLYHTDSSSTVENCVVKTSCPSGHVVVL